MHQNLKRRCTRSPQHSQQSLQTPKDTNVIQHSDSRTTSLG